MEMRAEAGRPETVALNSKVMFSRKKGKDEARRPTLPGRGRGERKGSTIL